MINALGLITKTAGCPAFGDWAIKNKLTKKWSEAKRGDIVLFDFNHNGTSDHIGIVTKVTSNYIETIEGNTGNGSDTNGDGVYKRTRYKSNVNYFVRPKYTDSVTAEMVITTALAEVGYKEGKNNNNKYGAWMNTNYQPWCCCFVCWVFAHVKSESNNNGKTYGGKLPDFHVVKTNQQVIDDAVAWAKWIVKENRFHYGYTNKSKGIDAHHNGCYFCGTNTTKGGRSKKGIVDYKFTYCCNPFVHAAWSHGGLVPAMLKVCKKGSSYGYKSNEGYSKSNLFKTIKKPKLSELKKGMVLCNDSHIVMYIGSGKIAEAAGGDDNKRNSEKWNNSIRSKKLTEDNYKKFKRVHLFIGTVDTMKYIEHGDISDDVMKLQLFLNWYGNYKLDVDRICGDATLNAIRDFQKKEGLSVDGVFGPRCLDKAKVIKK